MSYSPHGTGTTNALTKWAGANTVGDSNETDDGTTFTVGKRFAEKVLSPASFSTDQNDFNVGDASVIRLQTSVDSTFISGISGGTDGRRLRLTNIDATNTIVLLNDSVNSIAANRILTGLSTGFTTFLHIALLAGQSVELYYDGTVSRWRAYQPVVGFGGGSGGKNSVALWNNVGGSNYLVDTAGTLLVDPITGELAIADLSVNKITTYNGVTTAGKGVVPIHDVVQFPGQTSVQGPANFLNSSTAGLYRVSGFLTSHRDGSGGSGVSIKISFVNANGDSSLRQSAVLPLDVSGDTDNTWFIVTDGSASIAWETIYVSDGTYDVYLTVEKLSD